MQTGSADLHRIEALREACSVVAGALRIIDGARLEQTQSAEFVRGAVIALANVERALLARITQDPDTQPAEVRWQWNLPT